MTDDPVHTFLRDYAAAVFDRDLQRFVDLYAEDVQDVRVRVTAKDVKTWHDAHVAGGSATLAFAALDADGQPLRSTENRLTVLLRNEGGTWRVVHQHTSVPVDFQSKHVVSR